MLISLSRLTEAGLRFDHQYEAHELDLSHHEFTFGQAPLVTGRINRTGVDMRLHGQLTAALVIPCHRCLADVSLEIDTPLDLFYTPAEMERGKSGEAEVLARDLDFAVYENDEINLDDAVLEQLELRLPTRVLCREGCAGLCPQCGTNLNFEKCQCEKPVDPRWQALAELKNQGDE